jgi:Domain of unknown function (DUF1906)
MGSADRLRQLEPSYAVRNHHCPCVCPWARLNQQSWPLDWGREMPVGIKDRAFAGFPNLDFCSPNSGALAFSMDHPVRQAFLNELKKTGVETIIRYYDHEDETLPGKTLRRKERDLIISNGFKIAVCFQHHNDRLTSFSADRGHQDARRSLDLARDNLQPQKSAIYFGADLDPRRQDELQSIFAYFQAINSTLEHSGFRVGVYGSGLICRQIAELNLAELCWLACPTAWAEYIQYYRSKQWKLAQALEKSCANERGEFNIGNGRDADYGQFG